MALCLIFRLGPLGPHMSRAGVPARANPISKGSNPCVLKSPDSFSIWRNTTVIIDVNEKEVELALERAPRTRLSLAVHTALYRVQSSKHDANPINYRLNAGGRFQHPEELVPVAYYGLSQEAAIAESIQPNYGEPERKVVKYSTLCKTSLHTLRTDRVLHLVDAAELVTLFGFMPYELMLPKGDKLQGYQLPRLLTKVVSALGYDGIMYNSAMYCPAGSQNGRNVALFGGRDKQLSPVSYHTLLEYVLPTKETVLEFLDSRGVIVEAG
nr:RES family NAD+ phosphorylase [Pseudomonas sp. Pse1]